MRDDVEQSVSFKASTISSKDISRSAFSCAFFSWLHQNGFMRLV
jgi:hypothetical protein